jgi:hypothetical protein
MAVRGRNVLQMRVALAAAAVALVTGACSPSPTPNIEATVQVRVEATTAAMATVLVHDAALTPQNRPTTTAQAIPTVRPTLVPTAIPRPVTVVPTPAKAWIINSQRGGYYLGVSEDDVESVYVELLADHAFGTKYNIDSLVYSGHAFYAGDGTRVSPIRSSGPNVYVNVLSGPARGRSGWLPANLIDAP